MKPKLFISTPCHDGRVLLPYHVSVLKIALCGRFTVTVNHAKGGGISVARNNGLHDFLKTECDYLLHYDSDIKSGPEYVERLMSHNVDIVGACYGWKTPGPLKLSGKPLAGAEIDEKNGGLLEVAAIGTGFLLAKRKAVQAIHASLTNERYKGRQQYEGQVMTNVYGMGVMDRDDKGIGEYITEDFMFARHARACGYKVYCDTRFYLPHIGDIEYPTEKP